MALQNFVKTVWIANIMQSLEKAHVFASVANREYEGQLNSLGDKVKMSQIGDIAITSYSANSDISSPEKLVDSAGELVADQAYYFNFAVNDVDAVQQKQQLLSQATENGAYGFRDKVDQYFAELYAKAGIAKGSNASPVDINSANVEDVLVEVNELMGEANIPKAGRFAIIPEWFESKLVLAGLVTKTNNDQLHANGFIDRVLGIDFYTSNNVSKNSTSYDQTRILFGIKNVSLTFADVISDIEAYRPEKRFEDAVKGLYVFGGKIARPDMTLCLYADKTAES